MLKSTTCVDICASISLAANDLPSNQKTHLPIHIRKSASAVDQAAAAIFATGTNTPFRRASCTHECKTLCSALSNQIQAAVLTTSHPFHCLEARQHLHILQEVLIYFRFVQKAGNSAISACGNQIRKSLVGTASPSLGSCTIFKLSNSQDHLAASCCCGCVHGITSERAARGSQREAGVGHADAAGAVGSADEAGVGPLATLGIACAAWDCGGGV